MRIRMRIGRNKNEKEEVIVEVGCHFCILSSESLFPPTKVALAVAQKTFL